MVSRATHTWRGRRHTNNERGARNPGSHPFQGLPPSTDDLGYLRASPRFVVIIINGRAVTSSGTSTYTFNTFRLLMLGGSPSPLW